MSSNTLCGRISSIYLPIKHKNEKLSFTKYFKLCFIQKFSSAFSIFLEFLNNTQETIEKGKNIKREANLISHVRFVFQLLESLDRCD